MTAETVRFADFSGDYGTLGPRDAPPGSFAGLNVQKLVDGSLCPRPGLVNLAPTGVPVGVVKGMGWTQAGTAGEKLLWFVVGTSVYAFDGLALANAVETYTGALAVTPSRPVPSVDVINVSGQRLTYISVQGDKTYQLNHSTNTVTAVTASAGGQALCIYKDRMVGIAFNTGNRLVFSAANDFDTAWLAANFVDIGDGWNVTGLFPMRNGLLISKQDGSWWLLTGTLGVSTVLRKVSHGVGPSDGVHEAPHAAVIGDAQVWFLPSYRDYPARFNGATAEHLRHLRIGDGSNEPLDATPASYQVCELQYPDEVVVVSGKPSGLGQNRIAYRRNGIWTLHTSDVAISSWAAMGPLGVLAICDGGSAGSAARFFALNLDINRPPIAADTLARVHDDGGPHIDASVTFAEWWAPRGSEVQVRRVILDVTTWDTGAPDTNHVDVIVSALGRCDPLNTLTGSIAATTQSFDEAAATSSVSGTRRRITFGIGNQGMTAGFSLKLANLRGIQIHEALVELSHRRGEAPRPGVE